MSEIEDKDDRFANMFMFQTGMTQEQYAQEQKEIAASIKPSSLGQLKIQPVSVETTNKPKQLRAAYKKPSF